MSFSLDDTIAAVATAPGGAMRGMIRISGPAVKDCLAKCFLGDEGTSLDDVRRPTVISGRLRLASGVTAPCDLYFWPTTQSYTRQMVAEIHTIGSPPLLESALAAVCSSGARLAQPGEFTMRAFLAGRLDLTQAEAVLGVIDAADRRHLDTALAQLAGGLTGPMTSLRDELLDLLAHLEAGLDFVDEDIEFIAPEQLVQQLDAAADSVAAVAGRMSARGESTGEVRVVLTGWTNVGKSSLLNALAGQEAAIVAPGSGTTRDYVTVRTELASLSCVLVDTAGADRIGASDGIEAAAAQMAEGQQQQAQLTLLCLDSTRPPNHWERAQLAAGSAVGRIVVLTKTDAGQEQPGVLGIRTSAVSGEGIEMLREEIRRRAAEAAFPETTVVAGTAIRCRESLRLAGQCLGRARQIAARRTGEELVAAELRTALSELGKVVGAVYTDDVLDRIFGRFCIGK